MKWFLIFLSISLTASEKLDRTYLPPPGAQFAGGYPGDIQAPFEIPNVSQQVNIPVAPTANELNEFGTIGQSTQTTPVTTTSYAFTQTTTYPSVESYETTAVPINPVTGLPVLGQNGQQQFGINLPGLIQSQIPGLPGFGTNVPSGSLNQLPNQIITPGGLIQIPDLVSPGLGQSYSQHGQPNNDIVNQYPGQTIIIPGTNSVIPDSISLTPDNVQNLIQYPSEKNKHKDQFSETGFPGVAPGHISQDSHSKQPIIVPDDGLPQYNLDYKNKSQPILQQSFEHQNKIGPESIIRQIIYNPEHLHDGITSIAPGFSPSVAAHASVNDDILNRPQRPQAAADRNAVIINYENVRTPNGYSYSYDTSNGIHADEAGTVSDGTKAQGSYSYIGDDGKVYSVTYTADENGFQPHGDHLPTPPPIPEAIQKVIDQAARDEAAGIIDDGSYDEVKYGHDQYQGLLSYREPQTKDRNLIQKNKKIQAQRKIVKPIAGISEDDYYETEPHDHFTSDVANIMNIPGTTYTDHSNTKHPNVYEQIGTVSKDNGFLGRPNDMKKEVNFAQSRSTNINNSPASGDRHIEPKDGYLPTHQPFVPHTVESISRMGINYPGLQIEDVNESDTYPDNEERLVPEQLDQFEKPSYGSYSQDNGLPTISYRSQNMRQMPKGTSNNIYIKDGKTQSDQILNQGNIDDFVEIQKTNLLPSQQKSILEVNEDGYQYNSPQNKFPTRLNADDSYSTSLPLDISTTLRPFVTSEVHNQPSDSRPNVNRKNYNTQPFMTSSVVSRKEGPYTDYDDGDDYDIDRSSTTKKTSRPADVDTRRRFELTHSTSRPQYTPPGQRIRADEKELASPGQKIHYSVKPSYIQSSTTSIPPQNTILGNTEVRPNPGFSTSFMEPEFKISDTNISGLPQPSYGSRIPTGQRGSTVKSYPSTFTTVTRPVTRPAGGYTTSTPASVPSYGSRIPSGQRVTTIIPTTQEYQPSLLIPSETPEAIRQPTGTNHRNRYQYTTTVRPQNPQISDTKTFNRVYPNTAITTSRASTPNTQGILHGPKGTVSAPIDAYQTGYQYEPPKIVSNDGSPINTGPLSSSVVNTSPFDYKYATPRPVYSTTVSPSTIGTTPASLIPSPTPGRPAQFYSTTQRPGYSSTQNVFDRTPLVDGFGRPIPSEPQTNHNINQHPGTFVTGGEYIKTPDGVNTGLINQGSIPMNNEGPVYDVEPSLKYPGYNDQPQVIGEDFTGPKQPQRFDPQTGYHYK